MFCKFCGQELEEGSTLCQHCGKENPAEVSRLKTVLLAVGVTLGVLAVGATLVWLLFGEALKPKPNTVAYKDSYYVSDDEANANNGKVVATMGQFTLTNGQLQVFYWMQFADYVNAYASSGFDYTQPMDALYYDKTAGITYQQFFLESAINTWAQYQALTYEAELAGYQIPEEYQESLDSMREEMQSVADEEGFESLDALLQSDMGAGVTFSDYVYYMKLWYWGSLYFADEAGKLEATMEEMEVYYQDCEATVKGTVYEKGAGKLVDVRHVLLQPRSGSTDGNYSEEEWEACEREANAVYNNWLEKGDTSEESFDVLAQIHSMDGNAEEGGLYTNVYKGKMVAEFENWCFDESRKPGDHGIIKSQFGYHIMFFVGAEEGWIRYCREGVLSGKKTDLLEEMLAGYEHEVQYKDITLGEFSVS